jgi:hypothetical protein
MFMVKRSEAAATRARNKAQAQPRPAGYGHPSKAASVKALVYLHDRCHTDGTSDVALPSASAITPHRFSRRQTGGRTKGR